MSSCPGTMIASWYHIEELGEDMGESARAEAGGEVLEDDGMNQVVSARSR
eukprot:CAMPEP_0177239382 /NCGR_PEP_ID=MMETSP0367-20130122/47103_1 /TAXON_ID=447022 ORGANISM="Scrippsiella hangoei-like, Strain SHHI-4" /NCGR_SAMPLE_ID=MMETSP0367 /ASSEMBLY_ACC=CAM_ASM_000362 /LENGTH=49 /DNA_ID=CAMNT_0018690645 /DNA_START=35 /DNA_END=185 /DNA_ORIENTATION=+